MRKLNKNFEFKIDCPLIPNISLSENCQFNNNGMFFLLQSETKIDKISTKSEILNQLSSETENESALFKGASIQGSKKNMESNLFLFFKSFSSKKRKRISRGLDAETRLKSYNSSSNR